MCAAMSHGHSFQSSIFRLPAKCSGCHELVWGPFTRGCTCLTCSVTVHRSCTGMVTLPRCPTKDVFNAFCRAELGLAPLPAPGTTSAGPAAAAAAATGSRSQAGGGKDGDKATGEALSAENGVGGVVGDGSAAVAGGDLEEWAKVDGASGHSNSAAAATSPRQQQQQPPASASCAVQDLGSSFSWSPLAFGERKRPIVEDTSEGGRELAVIKKDTAEDAASSSLPEAADKEEAGRASPTAASAVATSAAADGAASSTPNNNNMGIRGVTKMSVAGGVVGALFGGPVGAVVGLKVGAVLGAGRSVQQGLWQRIEKNRREAGAEGIAMPTSADGEEGAVAAVGGATDEDAARKPRDVWARIAQQVEGERQPAIWCVSSLGLADPTALCSVAS